MPVADRGIRVEANANPEWHFARRRWTASSALGHRRPEFGMPNHQALRRARCGAAWWLRGILVTEYRATRARCAPAPSDVPPIEDRLRQRAVEPDGDGKIVGVCPQLSSLPPSFYPFAYIGRAIFKLD